MLSLPTTACAMYLHDVVQFVVHELRFSVEYTNFWVCVIEFCEIKNCECSYDSQKNKQCRSLTKGEQNENSIYWVIN